MHARQAGGSAALPLQTAKQGKRVHVELPYNEGGPHRTVTCACRRRRAACNPHLHLAVQPPSYDNSTHLIPAPNGHNLLSPTCHTPLASSDRIKSSMAPCGGASGVSNSSHICCTAPIRRAVSAEIEPVSIRSGNACPAETCHNSDGPPLGLQLRQASGASGWVPAEAEPLVGFQLRQSLRLGSS